MLRLVRETLQNQPEEVLVEDGALKFKELFCIAQIYSFQLANVDGWRTKHDRWLATFRCSARAGRSLTCSTAHLATAPSGGLTGFLKLTDKLQV